MVLIKNPSKSCNNSLKAPKDFTSKLRDAKKHNLLTITYFYYCYTKMINITFCIHNLSQASAFDAAKKEKGEGGN